jgi:hypothetical protein
MTETRVSFDWAYRGLRTCILENDLLRVTVVPDVGAKVHEMVFKPKDRDLLFHHPRVELRQPVFGQNADDWWSGGIDDVVPTGHPCIVDGEELPFLGEVWSMPWSSERVGAATVRFARQGVITPFAIEREMELRPGEPFVRVRHRIANVGTLPFRLIWGIHPSVPVSADTHVEVPATRGVIEESWPGDRLGSPGTEYAWPRPEIATPGADSAGTWDFHYATGLEAGWLAVWDGAWGCGFGMTFPHELLSCVWVWFVDGGWRGIRCVNVEPWLGYPARLDRAIEAGRAVELGPGDELEADTRLIAFEGRGSVRGFDEEGRPIR